MVIIQTPPTLFELIDDKILVLLFRLSGILCYCFLLLLLSITTFLFVLVECFELTIALLLTISNISRKWVDILVLTVPCLILLLFTAISDSTPSNNPGLELPIAKRGLFLLAAPSSLPHSSQ